MATENIVSKVYRVLTDVSSRVWDKISFWCLAKDVELANGKNLETTCGSITGITSSLTSTSTTMAASASAIKQLNDKIADLNSNLVKELVVNVGVISDVANNKVVGTFTVPKGNFSQIYLGGSSAISTSSMTYNWIQVFVNSTSIATLTTEEKTIDLSSYDSDATIMIQVKGTATANYGAVNYDVVFS